MNMIIKVITLPNSCYTVLYWSRCCSCVAIEKCGVARVAIYKCGVARVAIYKYGVARVAPV